MTRKYGILFCALLSWVNLGGWSQTISQSIQGGVGYLKITPTRVGVGAEVIVDSLFKGVLPLPPVPLSVGKHTLWVKNPDFRDWLARDFTTVVMIDSGKATTVEFHFPAFVRLGSRIPRARVYMGDKLVGLTPLWIAKDSLGVGPISIRKEGWEGATLRSPADVENPWDIALTRDEAWLKRQLLIEKALVRRGARKKIIIGLTSTFGLVSGAMAFYFKSEADGAYDKYLRAGNPDDMNHYYDRARLYDRWTGAAFASLQLDLGLTIFILLRK